MIRITPYYERRDQDIILQMYLRMIAAATPFLAEDVLYDDPASLALFCKSPKQRQRNRNGKAEDTEITKLLAAKKVQDRSDRDGQLLAEAELAEIIIQEYSDDLHSFLYDGSTAKGHVNRVNLRKLLLIRLPHGTIPDNYKYNEKRSGPKNELKARAKLLYEYVFRYDDFSSLKPAKDHDGIHDLVEKLGVKVCPYCNRLFTTTVTTKGHRIRPQLDHFRNKSKYPFLALSINNLVPACGVCNLMKLDKDLNDLIYPYDEDFEAEDYVFKTNIPANHSVPDLEGVPLKEDDFQILMARRNPDISVQDTERSERVKHSIQELSISELYQSHRDYVVFLYRQRYILTKQLAQDLFNQFGTVNGKKKLFDSVEDVEHVFTLMHTDYANWGNRPLAKLTRDITAEIDELYVKHPPKVQPVYIVKKSTDNNSTDNDT